MKGNKKKAESKKRGKGADDVYALFSASSTASLDSGYSSSSSSSSSRSSTSSSSSSVSGELFPPAARRRQAKKPSSSSPAAGAAAVVLCLLMVVFCGRIGATVLMSTALYLFPRWLPARTARGQGGVGSPECDAEEEISARRKVVRNQGFLLMRNRKK
ncbi:unnamed protein product [Urochloa humidicola]